MITHRLATIKNTVQLANLVAAGQPIFVIKPLTNSKIDFQKQMFNDPFMGMRPLYVNILIF
ncbi:SOS-response transcriptional repressor LexA [Peribacillus sp. B2I2]|uniref:hypothetical protein n=1 Tax=Peribacillus sp. B2I2 TaxID=3156468 RepID=UPI00351177B6